MFDPIIFPMVISDLSFRAAVIVTISSGKDVPTATIERAMIMSEGNVLEVELPHSGRTPVDPFVTLEDESGLTQVIVWPDLARKQRQVLLQSRLLAVEGNIQREGEVLHLIARRLADHSKLLGRLCTYSRNFR